jgi:hypothetical protein
MKQEPVIGLLIARCYNLGAGNDDPAPLHLPATPTRSKSGGESMYPGIIDGGQVGLSVSPHTWG